MITIINEKLFFPSHLIEKAKKGSVIELKESESDVVTCSLCAFQYNNPEDKKYSMPVTFPNLDHFLSKETVEYVCSPCQFMLDTKSLNALFNTSLITKDGIEFMNLNNSDMKDKNINWGNKKYVAPFTLGQRIIDILKDPPKEHWLLLTREIGAVNSKHVALNSKVNYGKGSFNWVSAGQKQIAIPNFEDNTLQELYDAISLLKSNVSMLDGDMRYFLEFNGVLPHEKSNVYKVWKEVYPIIKDHVNTGYFNYIYTYLAPSYSLMNKLEKRKKKKKKTKK